VSAALVNAGKEVSGENGTLRHRGGPCAVVETGERLSLAAVAKLFSTLLVGCRWWVPEV
jgi:hypothetical protein